MKNDPHENIHSSDENLRAMFNSWNPKLKTTELWQELSESLEFEKSLNELKTDFDHINEIVPPSIWGKIDASLIESQTESTLQRDFENWGAEPNESSWENIKQSTLLEKVWVDLSNDLITIQAKKSNFVLQFCSVFLILIVTFYINDGFFEVQKKLNSNSVYAGKKTSLLKKPVTQVVNSIVSNKVNNSTTYAIQRNSSVEATAEFPLLSTTALSTAKQALLTNENKVVELDHYAVSHLNLLDFSVLSNSKASLVPLNISARKERKRFIRVGVDFFSALNFIEPKRPDALSITRGAIGYELGLFLCHPLQRLSQEYFLNYAVYRQNESGYRNGSYSQSILTVSGIKISTLTKFSNKNNLSYGLGLSTFFPFQSVKERNNMIVEIPKTDFLNVGFNVDVDYSNFSFSPQNKFILGMKYEFIFPVIATKSGNKNYQNLSLGIKYKI